MCVDWLKRSNRPNSPTRLTFLPIIKRKKFSIFLSISFIQPNWAFIDFGAEEICYFFSVHRLVIDASVPVRWYYFHRDRAVSCYFFPIWKDTFLAFLYHIGVHWFIHIFFYSFFVLCCAMLWKTDCNSKDQHMYIYVLTKHHAYVMVCPWSICYGFLSLWNITMLIHCAAYQPYASHDFFSSLHPYMHIKTIVYYTRLQYNVSNLNFQHINAFYKYASYFPTN